jgi:hypothetical protein
MEKLDLSPLILKVSEEKRRVQIRSFVQITYPDPGGQKSTGNGNRDYIVKSKSL